MAPPTRNVAIIKALRARVESIPNAPRFVWPADVETDPEGYHIEVAYLIVEPLRIYIDEPDAETLGTLQLVLKHPLKGLIYHRTQQLAGLAAAHFPQDLSFHFGSTCVTVTAQPEISEGFREDQWWKTPIRIRWRSIG